MAIRGEQRNVGPFGVFGTTNAFSTVVTYSLTGGATSLALDSAMSRNINIGQNRIFIGQFIASNAATVTGGAATALQVSIAGQQALFNETPTHLWSVTPGNSFALASTGSNVSYLFVSPFAGTQILHYFGPQGITLSNTGAGTDTIVGQVSMTLALYARAD